MPEVIGRLGLRGGHPTAWKFRHWSAPDERKGQRRLKWSSMQDDYGLYGPYESDPIIGRLFEDQPFHVNNLANEGESDIVDVYFQDQAVRSALYIRGYNDTILETDTLSTVTGEVTGTGYAALTYTRGTDWTHAGSVVTGATKTWTAGGTWTAMTHIGIGTVASGTSGLLIAYAALSATRTLANTETLDVTPVVTAT